MRIRLWVALGLALAACGESSDGRPVVRVDGGVDAAVTTPDAAPRDGAAAPDATPRDGAPASDATPRDAGASDAAMADAAPDALAADAALLDARIPDATPPDAAAPDAAPPADCTPAADPGPDVPLRHEGRYVRTDAFPSTALGRPRGLTVYLPADYDARPDARYDVLYMHDGQNLFFDDEAAFGAAWHVAETLDALVDAGRVPPLIVVGVHNTAARIDEYTPSRDPGEGAGGRSADYARFLTDELDPWVRFHFRTLCGPAHTGVMGSSLGGLVSLDLLRRRPDFFGRVGALSSSLFWNRHEAMGWVPALSDAVRHGARIWIDAGGFEEDPMDDGRPPILGDARDLAEALPHVPAVAYLEDPPSHHNEPAWAGRLAHALLHLYGQPSPPASLTARVFAWPLTRQTAFSVDVRAADGRMRTLLSDEVQAAVEPAGLAAVDGLTLRPGDPGAGTLTVHAGALAATLPLRVAAGPLVPVTFVVAAPDGTDAVFLTGSDAALGPWAPDAFPLAPSPAGLFSATVQVADGPLDYKYTRGGWDTVEKAADGSELANRQVTPDGPARVEDRVERWNGQ